MSATNLTKNLKLPQFVASDKPSWLGDFNGAMKNIDDGVGVIKGDITKASDTASSAKSQSDANAVTLGNVNTELENQGNRITALEAGGGTEQLEQRVNTLGTDVEALQTRADTFEEEIAENGNSITTLKDRVDAIEPKVKANADNITSLTTATQGLNTTVSDITENLSKTTSVATRADTNASSALTLAQSANSKAVSAETTANSLSSELSNKTSTDFSLLALTPVNSKFAASTGAIIYNKTQYILFLTIQTSTTFSASSAPTNIYTFDLSSFTTDLYDKSLAFNDFTLQHVGHTFIISATKENNSNIVTINIKSTVSAEFGKNYCESFVTSLTFY